MIGFADPFRVHTDFARRDLGLGQGAGLEKPRVPQPFVDTDAGVSAVIHELSVPVVSQTGSSDPPVVFGPLTSDRSGLSRFPSLQAGMECTCRPLRFPFLPPRSLFSYSVEPA